MAELITKGVQEISTSAPQLQTVENAPSGTASAIEALGTLGTKLYELDVLRDADESSRGVIDQLDADIDAAAATDARVEKINKELASLSEGDPRIQEFEEELKVLGTGRQQRREARKMYDLRAEDALRKTLARAPGLRREVTAIAARNLGFDPSHATITALLGNLDEEWKLSQMKTGEKEDDWLWKERIKGIASRNISYTSTGDKNLDIANIDAINSQYDSYVAEIDFTTTQLADNLISEKDALSSYYSSMSKMVGLQIKPLVSSVGDLLTQATTGEDLTLLKGSLMPQLNLLKSEMIANLDAQFSNLTLSADSQVEAAALKDRIVREATAGFDAILSAETFSEAESRAKTLATMTDNLKLDVVTANKVLTAFTSAFPGAIGVVMESVLMQEPQTRDRLKNLVSDSLVNLSDSQVKAKNLGNLLSVMTDQAAFSSLDEAEKIMVANQSMSIMKGFVEEYKDKPMNMHPTDLRSVANAFASGLQLSNQFVTSDWERVSHYARTPVFTHMIDALYKEGGDSRMMGEALADAALEAHTNKINDAVLGAVESVSGSGRSHVALDFDAATGEMSFEVEFPNWRKIHRSDHKRDRAAEIATRTFNETVQSVYDLRAHDPHLKDMTKAEIAFYISPKLLGSSYVTVHGTPPQLTTPANVAADKALSFEELVSRHKKALSETSIGLQTGGLDFESDEDFAARLEALSVQRRELTARRAEATSGKTGLVQGK